MNKFKVGDIVVCTHGFEGKNHIRGHKGEVMSVGNFLGRVMYRVKFWINFDGWWLPASHLRRAVDRKD